MLESAVERAFVAAGERRGGWIVKLRVLGISGFPDRLCLLPGGIVALVELKRPGAKPRKLQRWVHARLRELGLLVEVIDRVEQIEPFYQALWERNVRLLAP